MNTHLEEENRIWKHFRNQYIDDVIQGEVRIFEKVNGVLNIKIATLEDIEVREDDDHPKHNPGLQRPTSTL